jgi:hypothetical protein
VGVREQDGVGAATVIWIGRVLSRTYLAPSAHGPSAQQPTASRACTCSPGAMPHKLSNYVVAARQLFASALAISSAQPRIRLSSMPSIMTRALLSVPL